MSFTPPLNTHSPDAVQTNDEPVSGDGEEEDAKLGSAGNDDSQSKQQDSNLQEGRKDERDNDAEGEQAKSEERDNKSEEDGGGGNGGLADHAEEDGGVGKGGLPVIDGSQVQEVASSTNEVPRWRGKKKGPTDNLGVISPRFGKRNLSLSSKVHSTRKLRQHKMTFNDEICKCFSNNENKGALPDEIAARK
uniref:Uncharacterized protein n=1 Tax=Oryza punctata TaxID=4537 RepID=A0A0E0JT41_ORYPU